MHSCMAFFITGLQYLLCYGGTLVYKLYVLFTQGLFGKGWRTIFNLLLSYNKSAPQSFN